MQTISVLSAIPSQWALQYFDLSAAGQLQAAFAHFLELAIVLLYRFARPKTPLILDFGHLDFLSVDGFRALLALNHEQLRAGVHCSVVAGASMRPLLRIVRQHGLRVVGSVAEGLQLIEDTVGARGRLLPRIFRPSPRRPQRRLFAAIPR